MASYNELLALIDAYINQNGVQAITGQVLNGVLRAMVDQLGRGYAIMGAADPTTDPGTPDGPETWFASVPGTYTNFDGIQIVPGELALLSYVPSTGFSKNTIYEGFQTVQATIDGNVGTPAVGVSYANGILSFDFHNMKGVTGDPAGFGAVTASVDGNIGTPSVQVQTSGPDTAKAIAFQFHNLKGETGVTSVLATVDNTSGNPQCAVSLNGQQLVLNFTGLKGAQGDTGSSVDYPFTIVNNLTTNDPAQALSAAMGVQLESEVSQLEAEVNEKADQADLSQLRQEVDGLFAESPADLDLSDEDGNAVARFNGGHIKTLNFDSKEYTDKDILSTPNKIDALSVNKFLVDTRHTYNLLNPSDFDGVDSGFIPISPENGSIIHMHFLEYVYYDRATKATQNITINPFSTFCRFYDSNKDIISVDINNTYQKAIPSNAAFVKIRLIDAKYKDVAWLSYDYTAETYSRGGIEHREYPKELGFTKTGYEDFTIVCFGDSITQGIERKPLNISYVSYLEDILHCHTINVGFGGTRMAYVGASPLFSFANLADVIVSEDADKWDALDNYVSEEVPGYAKHLANLKNIDWSKVDAISVFYGMNDYAYQGSGTPIGAEGSMDKTTFNGACAYGLDKLLTKYPWLQVILITPYDRYMDASTNSSNTANSVGKYMKDYADSLVGVQNIFRCPILDFYRESNINKYSYNTMTNDGVHAYVYPTLKRLSKMLAGCITNELY